jgi:hypothetical protein
MFKTVRDVNGKKSSGSDPNFSMLASSSVIKQAYTCVKSLHLLQ